MRKIPWTDMAEKSVRWCAGLAVAAALAGAPSGPARAQGAKGGARPPQAVTVVTLKAQDVTLTSELPGRVVASAVAEVRPQVNGIITARLFDEGTPVKVGDPLYRIDPSTYTARVAAAKASVAQAEATLRSAQREVDRVSQLIDRKVVSAQTADQTLTARDTAAAGVQVAKADLQAAEIDLAHTTIRAPLSGTIGVSLTTQGALVTDGQAGALAIIRTLDPVLVDVTQSAADIIAWQRGDTAKRLKGAQQHVSLKLADGSTYDQTGVLTAADPYVNEQTGVVTLRLTFPNPDNLLLPGMYVQVEMPQGVAHGVILAPMKGVSRDRRGNPVAMVVNKDDVIEERHLTILEASGSDWVVSKGLKDGDRMVVAGLQKIRPGAKVAPEEQKPASAGQAGAKASQ